MHATHPPDTLETSRGCFWRALGLDQTLEPKIIEIRCGHTEIPGAQVHRQCPFSLSAGRERGKAEGSQALREFLVKKHEKNTKKSRFFQTFLGQNNGEI